jgi:hypothetical protein
MYLPPPCTVCVPPVLQLHNLRKFVPHNSRLRPAYFIAVDHRARAIIWGECVCAHTGLWGGGGVKAMSARGGGLGHKAPPT